MKRTSVLYIFNGVSRQKLERSLSEGTASDSALRGYNHLKEYPDLSVEYLDLSQDLPSYVPRALRRFPFLHITSLLHLSRIARYDAVITSETLFLSLFVPSRTKWIYLAINTSALMRRHERHIVQIGLLRLLWRRATRILYLAENQKADLERVGLTKTLVPLAFGIDTEFYDTGKEGNAVVSVGRDLGRDYQTLLSACVDLSYPLVIAAAPKNIAPGLKLSSGVDVRYDCSLDEIRSLYNEAALIVIPLLPEGAAEGSDCSGQTVLLEALSAGKAVIATRHSWIREYLEEGKEYVGVDAGDASMLRGAIDDLMRDPERRRALGQAGRERVQRDYSTRSFAKQLHAVILSVCKKPS